MCSCTLEDDFAGFAAPSTTIGGAAAPGVATTAMRSDAAPELGPLTSDLDFGGFKATSLSDPSGAQHAATKAYVESVAQGLAPKDSVRAATTGDITLSGVQAIDGVSVVAGDRVLVKDQSVGSANGIHVAAAGAWSRAADADSGPRSSSPRDRPSQKRTRRAHSSRRRSRRSDSTTTLPKSSTRTQRAPRRFSWPSKATSATTSRTRRPSSARASWRAGSSMTGPSAAR